MKTGERATVPWVRIPPLPPELISPTFAIVLLLSLKSRENTAYYCVCIAECAQRFVEMRLTPWANGHETDGILRLKAVLETGGRSGKTFNDHIRVGFPDEVSG
ncbi:hypothetical protein [Sphingomonas sp. Leaf9]|uniref:hypothetical protein n=1 Tax=Sphingomonas sp. Leaf9 TaxID=1735674 RepID=UPI0012E2C0E6|nr:hypothetical protein [Sphingomonas sp. Leaf9]